MTICLLTFCQNILAFHLETLSFFGQTGTSDHLLFNFLSKYSCFSFWDFVFFWPVQFLSQNILWSKYHRNIVCCSVPKSLVFIRATRIYEHLRKKYSYFTRIFVVYSYLRAHSTRCELFDPVKSFGNDSAILKQSKNMLLNFELHRSTMNLHQKICWFTHFCRKNVASWIYALF